MSKFFSNRLTIDVSTAGFKKIAGLIGNERRPIDFSQIIPIPDSVSFEKDELGYRKWCRENWGSCSNAYRPYIDRDGTINFLTLDSIPVFVIAKLAVLFPNAQLLYTWSDNADENCDSGLAIMSNHIALVHRFQNDSERHDDCYTFNKNTGNWDKCPLIGKTKETEEGE